jgi:hypothetical protein
MNLLLKVIAAIAVAITVGVMVSTFHAYSGIAYVLFLLLDLVAFSFFCIRKRIVLVRPFIFFVGTNLVITMFFLSRG